MKTPILLFVCLPAFPACLPVTGDRILGRDLALADPRFAVMPESYTVAPAPPPGAQRVLAGPELGRLATAHGISLSAPAEFCFEVPVRHPEDEDLIRAMRKGLQGAAGVDITIVERSANPVPAGEIVFPAGSLSPSSSGEHNVQLWRGYVQYTGTRRAAVWARVSITQQITAAVALRNLPPDLPIGAESVRLETRRGPLVHEVVALRVEDVVGRIPKRPVSGGSMIPLNVLAEAPVVRRGDRIKVEVCSGTARLRFDAVAEREARAGETVELRNPSSGKIFRARLEGSKALVVLP